MGNTNQKLEDYDVVRSFHPEQWQNKEVHGSFEIWENSSKNLRSDVYPINTEIKQTDLDRYEMRHNANDDIVKVHHLRIQNEPSLCSKSSSAHLFVERIPYRLPSLTELSHSESLSILRSAYSGFDQISKFYGQIEPYEDMICFNEEGKCKVWINSNLAENEVEKNRQSKDTFRNNQTNEANINKIFDMVECRTVGRSLPEGLKNSLRNKSPKNYYEAINVLEEYAGENRVNIPRTINNRILENSRQKVEEQLSQNQLRNQYYDHPHQINSAQHISTLPQNIDAHSESITHPYNSNQFSKQTSSMIRQPSQTVFTAPVTSVVQGPPISRTLLNQRNQGNQYFIKSNGNSMFSIMPNQASRGHIQFHTEEQGQIKRIHSPITLPTSIQKDQSNRPIEPQSPSPSLRLNSPNKSVRSSQLVKDEQIKLQCSPVIFKTAQNFHIPPYPLNVRQFGNVGRIEEATLRYPPASQQGMWANQVQSVHPLQIHPSYEQRQSLQQQPQSQINLQNKIPLQIQKQRHAQSPTPVQNLPHLQLENVHSELASHSQAQEQLQIEKISIQSEQSNEVENLGPENQEFTVLKQSEEKNEMIPTERESRELSQDINERRNLSVENEHGFREARSEENSNQEEGQEEEEDRMLESENEEENRNEERESQPKQEYEEEQEEKQFDESEIDRENYEMKNENEINENTQGHIDSVQFGTLNNEANNNIEYVENVEQPHLLQEVEQTVQQKDQPEAKIKRVSTVEVHVPSEKLVSDGEQHSELNEKDSSDEKSVQSGEAISEKNVKEDRKEGYNYEYKSSTEKINNGENRIPDNAGYEDIEQYIRNKYKKYLNTNPEQNATNVNVDEMSSYVESKYDQYTNSNANQNTQFSFRPTREEERRKSKHVTIENEYLRGDPDQSERSERDVGYNNDYVDERQFGVSHEDAYREEYQNDKTIEKVSERGTEKALEEEGDILDVRFLEKSLDKKYSSLKSNKQIKNITNENEEDHGFSVKKLEENLMRFEESKVSQNQQFNFNSSNPIFETSQVSKINSIDHLLAQRRSSMKKEESEYYETGRNTNYQNGFNNNYENKLPGETHQKRNSARTANITRELSNIDEKFNKYVTRQASSKTILKPKEQNYEEVYDASSRMATGHFGYPEEKVRSVKNDEDYDDYSGKFFATSEVRSHKGGISYDELRKYMWS